MLYLKICLSSSHSLYHFSHTHFQANTLSWFVSHRSQWFLGRVSLSDSMGYVIGWRSGVCKSSLGGLEWGDLGGLRGVSDTLAKAPRAQQDQCVWSRASSPHNERKWEFNTNFLTKSQRPPASVAGLTSRHPQLGHHHLHYNHNKMSETTKTCPGACCYKSAVWLTSGDISPQWLFSMELVKKICLREAMCSEEFIYKNRSKSFLTFMEIKRFYVIKTKHQFNWCLLDRTKHDRQINKNGYSRYKQI